MATPNIDFNEDMAQETMEHVISVEDMEEDGHIPVTHRLASHLGVDAQQVQVMKASFFADEEDDEKGTKSNTDSPFSLYFSFSLVLVTCVVERFPLSYKVCTIVC